MAGLPELMVNGFTGSQLSTETGYMHSKTQSLCWDLDLAESLFLICSMLFRVTITDFPHQWTEYAVISPCFECSCKWSLQSLFFSSSRSQTQILYKFYIQCWLLPTACSCMVEHHWQSYNEHLPDSLFPLACRLAWVIHCKPRGPKRHIIVGVACISIINYYGAVQLDIFIWQ